MLLLNCGVLGVRLRCTLLTSSSLAFRGEIRGFVSILQKMVLVAYGLMAIADLDLHNHVLSVYVRASFIVNCNVEL